MSGERLLYAAMRRTLLWLPVIVWAAIILSSSNDSFSADQSRGWLATVFGREVPYAVNYTMRKAAHLIAYGILGALAWRAEKRVSLALIVTLLVAMTDEYSQGLTRSRTGSSWDVLLDVCGAVLAMAWLRREASRCLDETFT
jgi:VanZ family protein